MAHRLARSDGPESDDHSSHESADRSDKWTLNRRNCLKIGGTAIVSLLFGGASSSAAANEEPNVHWTNFSEAQL